MDCKRYYFRLEMEQLPDEVWHQFKSCALLQEMGLQEKSEMLERIEELPEPLIDCLKQTLKKIRDEQTIKFIKANPEKFRMFLTCSVAVSEEDRRLAEVEDEAWKDL